MKHILLSLSMAVLLWLDVSGQNEAADNVYFFKEDSTYLVVDNSENHFFTFELKADTMYLDENNMIVCDNKIMQINVVPFSRFIKKSMTIDKALQAHKKWELKYQQNILGCKLKNGQEMYDVNHKPFLIWWLQNPPFDDKDSYAPDNKIFDIETATFVEVQSFTVTHMLNLYFPLYGNKSAAITFPVYENENLNDEIYKLKVVANSMRHYGALINTDLLAEIQKSHGSYVFHDSKNLLEFQIPEWLNVTRIKNYPDVLSGSFPESYEVVNAMIMRWEYPTDSLSFQDFINRAKVPRTTRPNYRFIEETDSTLRYFYTCEDNWFYMQDVYLRGDNIYLFINFTATRNTYDFNIGRFEEFLSGIKFVNSEVSSE